ncbi:DUF6325 family protein [Iamia majanohamensis]|uniref:DUF6325 family protein n=1 Tax=Iamia majanohamensis TaxID=467976 RepID=A0AAE9Y9B9_9ACTN|nr:DUF6325 family protein [Iamia majanohamensis]WCO68161.1 DUF6325 family protein [Iamia majanohamensis]
MGPVEVLVIGFPGSRFNGDIVPSLVDVVERGIISIVDAILVSRDEDGGLTVVELEEEGAGPEVAALAALVDEVHDLVSDEDVEALAADIEPGSSAAVLVFEHTWALPLRDAVAGSGGVVLSQLRVPGAVVDEVLDAVAALD